MALSDLRAYVTHLSPTQFDTATANAIVNDAYGQVCRRRPWLWMQKQLPLWSNAGYNTGTVALTSGSATVTGTGSSWTAAMVGMYLVIGARQPIRITAVGSGTSLTIAANWGEANLSGQQYKIIQSRFVMPSDFERVLRLTGEMWPLQRRDSQVIDALDPNKSTFGPPLIYAEVENVVSGSSSQKEIELWPIPTAANTFTLSYRSKFVPLVNDADVARIEEDVIAALAQSMAATVLAGRTGEAMWLQLAQTYKREYAELLQPLEEQDDMMRGSNPVVFDTDDQISDGTDPAFAQWYRAWQSFGLTKVA